MVRYYSETPVCQKVSEDTEVLVSAVLTVPHITEPLFIFFFQLQMHANKLGAGDGLLQMKETAIDHVVRLYRESLTLTSQTIWLQKKRCCLSFGVLQHFQLYVEDGSKYPVACTEHNPFQCLISLCLCVLLHFYLRMSMLAYWSLTFS